MEMEETRDVYFEWLYDRVKGVYYDELLKKLYNRPFYIDKSDRDYSRVVDGLKLRAEFNAQHPKYKVSKSRKCSFLEVLIAMAARFDDEIMYEEKYGDRSIDWFWCFIDNMGLSHATDSNWNHHWDRFVDDKCSAIINRDYKKNGVGGLFTIRNHPNDDIRMIPLWTQLNWWLDENLRIGLVD